MGDMTLGEWVRVYPMCTAAAWPLADCAGGGRLAVGADPPAAAAVVMGPTCWGWLPSTNEQTAALVVNGGGGRLGAEQGASIRHGDPRHELAAVWIPDRGGDGGDDRPAASRIPALRTAGRPHVRRIAAVAVGFGAAAAAAALRLHNRRLGGVLGRLEGRSSILGHYSGSDCCPVVLVVCGLAALPAVLGGSARAEPSVVCERLSSRYGRASALRGESGVPFAFVRSPEKPSQTAPSL